MQRWQIYSLCSMRIWRSTWEDVACVASVSVRCRNKERGTRVKDRAKNGESKRAGRGGEERKETLADKPLPWVPEVFLACGGNFRCWPKAEATSGEARVTIKTWQKPETALEKSLAPRVTNPGILKTARLACHAWVSAPTFDAVNSCHNWPIK